MIKVLMLGWEFPPNISGGLGVACEGLANALADTNQVSILFVMPTSSPGPGNKNMTLIGADTISIPANKNSQSTDTVTYEGQDTSFEIKRVDATLMAYESVLLEERIITMSQFPEVFEEIISNNSSDGSQISYSFTGGYGVRLLDEVEKYTKVVTKLAMESEFDIIHAHDWMTFPAAVAIRKISGKPLVVHLHATEFDRASTSGSSIVYDIEQMAVNNCEKVISVSALMAEKIVERYGVGREKIEVVHNGIVSSPKRDSSIKSHPLGSQLVTFLGRITFQKGPEYFVDAADKVLKEFPKCHFVMAGTGDALPAMIRRVIERRMSANFHFTGFLNRSEVIRLLSFTRVYVMPSVSEPFGLTALEAINAGVPTVISKQSGVSEVMPDALKVDFWDVDGLARAISGVLRYPLAAETLRHNAFSRIESISWPAAANKVVNIYKSVLKRVEDYSPSIS
jgi:glycogen(starch) synthase